MCFVTLYVSHGVVQSYCFSHNPTMEAKLCTLYLEIFHSIQKSCLMHAHVRNRHSLTRLLMLKKCSSRQYSKVKRLLFESSDASSITYAYTAAIQ